MIALLLLGHFSPAVDLLFTSYRQQSFSLITARCGEARFWLPTGHFTVKIPHEPPKHVFLWCSAFSCSLQPKCVALRWTREFLEGRDTQENTLVVVCQEHSDLIYI